VSGAKSIDMRFAFRFFHRAPEQPASLGARSGGMRRQFAAGIASFPSNVPAAGLRAVGVLLMQRPSLQHEENLITA
jgi:hypothetical protein